MVTLDGFGGLVQDFDWNVDGSLLATSSKVPACYGTLVCTPAVALVVSMFSLVLG